ncbi:MAG: OsmC family protein [Anaerolineales bacterium]|jgi:putative redox protein
MTVTAKSITGYQIEIDTGSHQFIIDEPVSKGGDDAGPTPYDTLLAALAGCKAITVQMYARRKGWLLEKVILTLQHSKIHADDCEDCDGGAVGKIDIIDVDISFEGDLSEEQLKRLKEISNRCPVHKTLITETKIRTK